MQVLIVDDEPPILEAVAYNLRKEGYEPLTATDAEQAMAMVRAERPALVILDVMLPGASGLDVCRRIRRESAIPIIMLTARADETDRVVGLELGADDYVTKPFSMRELMVRVKAVLRRATGAELASERPVITADVRIDPSRFETRVRGNRVELSPREFALLYFLASHPEQVFSRQTLLDRVWGQDAFVEERTIDVHVRWLREKIEEDPSQPRRILTVRGVGYRFSAE